jgi:hypothetical protein
MYFRSYRWHRCRNHWEWRHAQAAYWHQTNIVSLGLMALFGTVFLLQLHPIYRFFADLGGHWLGLLVVASYPITQLLFNLRYIAQSHVIWSIGWALMLANSLLDGLILWRIFC